MAVTFLDKLTALYCEWHRLIARARCKVQWPVNRCKSHAALGHLRETSVIFRVAALHAGSCHHVIHLRVDFPHVLEVVIMAVEVVALVLHEQRLELLNEWGVWAMPPNAVDRVVSALLQPILLRNRPK